MTTLFPANPAPLANEIRPRGRGRRTGPWRVAGDLPLSLRYAAQGLAHGFLTQRNFRIHVVVGAFTFGLGLWLQLSPDRLAVLVLTVTAVLVLELINTAIESVVDLAIGRRFQSPGPDRQGLRRSGGAGGRRGLAVDCPVAAAAAAAGRAWSLMGGLAPDRALWPRMNASRSRQLRQLHVQPGAIPR